MNGRIGKLQANTQGKLQPDTTTSHPLGRLMAKENSNRKTIVGQTVSQTVSQTVAAANSANDAGGANSANSANSVNSVNSVNGSHNPFEVLGNWPGSTQAHSSVCPNVCFVIKRGLPKAILGRPTIGAQPSTCIMSSRLPKVLDNHQNWFDAIRTIGIKLGRSKGLLLTAEGTTAHRYCLRIAELFALRCVTIESVPANKFNEVFLQSELASDSTDEKVYVVTDKELKSDPLLATLADSAYVLSARPQGNVARAIQNRVANKESAHRTFVLHDDALIAPKTRLQLLDGGAIDWLLLQPPAATTTPLPSKQPATTKPHHAPQVRSLGEINQDDYLIHWTRARPGPWPEQSETDHLDDLIFGSPRSRHAEIFSLCRILAAQRIIAAGELTRDHTPVVCFSEVPLSQIRNNTVYRKHLQRWDFLPYGIAIKRSVLQQQFQCQPVIYGDDATWNQLSPQQKPLFQFNGSGGQEHKHTGVSTPPDWRQEREWRVIGDVNLRKISPADALLFVGKEKELEKLAILSLYDLIVI